MNPVLTIALSAVFVLASVAGWRVYSNHRDIKRLKASGYHKLAARRKSQRGYVEVEFLRALVEFAVIVALLISLFAFMAFFDPTT